MPSLYIDREECIGDSLIKLNSNFSGLDADITNVNTRVTNTSAAAITLTNSLSAGIRSDRYTAKAWVSFTGTGPIGNQTIYTQYNVSSVNKTAEGTYIINYTTPISSGTNCIVGSCADNGGGFFVCSNGSTSNSATISTIRVGPLSVVSSNYINVVVFGY